jgi:hypothetical protein
MGRISRLLCGCALALVVAPSAAAGPGMFVGAAEDASRSTDLVQAYAKMELARLAGMDAIRITSIWYPGQTEPNGYERLVLQNVGTAAQLHGIRVIVSVYHRDQRTTPLTPRARSEFASYAAAIVRDTPAISDVIVGNEPNLNLFWMPQFTRDGKTASAGAYVRLLAQTYDALKAVSPDVNVIGGSVSPRGQDRPNSPRHTHSPARFIPEMAKAYRQLKRRQPIMDAFAFHPYLIPSRLPPTFRHAHPRNTTIGLSDYDKLTKALASFDGTAQRGSTLPIVYDEFGYQSEIPPAKQSVYTHLSSPAARDAIPEALQAQYYRRALAIAQCQPNVTGILLFHVTDEEDARAWQSGLYYADDTPKSSLEPVRDAALAARDGRLARCSAANAKRVNPLRSVTFAPESEYPEGHADWRAHLTCDRPCRYSLRIVPAEAPGIVPPLALLTGARRSLQATGAAPAGVLSEVAFPAEPLLPGSYQFVLRVFETGRPGTAVLRISDPFRVVAPVVPGAAPPDPPPPAPAPDPDPDPPEDPPEDPPKDPEPPPEP